MQFTSTDVEQVETTWQQFVPSSSLQNADRQRFRFDWRSEDLRSVTLVNYRLAAQIHSRAEPQDQLLVCRVDASDARVWSSRQPLDPRSPWISDGTRVEAKWDRSARVRAFVIDRASAEKRARQMTGDDRLDLRATGLAPHSIVDARRWEKTFAYVDDVLGTAVAEPLLIAELERHVLTMTLSTFPTTFTEPLRRPTQRAAAPASVRRALAYIDENAHRAITIDEVAAASFISTRGLQYAFRRALDITPADALRRARLDGAHRDLRNGGGHSVGEIARRWGFSNSSRFAAAYQAAYGTAPSLPSP
ncbi:helix-turn-helix transcriptional regulator [Microbacterium sp. MYb62]|uniref:helix-turn-helix transcriptional regulator n=1 Tax=Microbacterium sp. MYb62 TaxID=1848690 RepID=UPI000CFCEA12|nr:helix-turn-helix transcriptional regulator [Microbacterium sp. MYb62]PRB18891.1 AraC family transcriptional regulator [Microbacterium sp. MYb62]